MSTTKRKHVVIAAIIAVLSFAVAGCGRKVTSIIVPEGVQAGELVGMESSYHFLLISNLILGMKSLLSNC